MRVVSLVPFSTETLIELGAEVIACTRFCEQPNLLHVGGTKNPDVAAIVSLAVDLVVMDREENRREDYDTLVAAGCNVFASDVRSIAEALDVVEELAVLSGVRPSAAVPTPSPRVGESRTAFMPIWRRPWMTIGTQTYGGSMLEHLGIDLVTAGSSKSYPTVELDDIAALAPQLVLVPSEPYEFTDEHVAELRDRFTQARIVRVDGKDLFWWGARTAGAITRLAEAIS